MSHTRFLKDIVKKILDKLRPPKITYAHISQLSPSCLLQNKCALITGATSGIGFEIAKAYLKAGAKVIITGRSINKTVASCNSLSKYGECKYIVFDVTKINETEAFVKEAIATFGRIDILVNNAGISGCSIQNGTPELFNNVINTNLRSVFFLSQYIGRYMKEHMIKGNILNISSASSIRPAACAYTISKWGVRGFTLGLARTLLPYGITVNALAPGPVATPLLHKNAANDDLALPNTPYGRYALPEEIANMAVILVSPIARLIIGDTIFMTGGAGNINNGDIDYPF